MLHHAALYWIKIYGNILHNRKNVSEQYENVYQSTVFCQHLSILQYEAVTVRQHEQTSFFQIAAVD